MSHFCCTMATHQTLKLANMSINCKIPAGWHLQIYYGLRSRLGQHFGFFSSLSFHCTSCMEDLTQYASDRSLDTCTLTHSCISITSQTYFDVRLWRTGDDVRLWRTGDEENISPLSPVLHTSYVRLACETLPACTTYTSYIKVESTVCNLVLRVNRSKVDVTPATYP